VETRGAQGATMRHGPRSATCRSPRQPHAAPGRDVHRRELDVADRVRRRCCEPGLVGNPMTLIDRATSIAHDIRAGLLRYEETPRNLAGQCGLAAMLIAAALKSPRSLRSGFYMKFETLFGKRGYYPHRHAWCRVGSMIIDVTATQFSGNNKAVHAVRYDEDDRYVECARGAEALDDIMASWRGRELPAYARIARQLRARIAGAARAARGAP
jgi:hypothetical protein